MKQLTDKEAAAHGISAVHHEMDNGELRFRLVSTGGSSYIMTKSTGCNGWQNSHVHHRKQEFYVVEKGFALFALLQNGRVQFKKLCENESLSIPLGVAHNVLLSDNAVLHTVKYGTQDEDWNPCPELDEQLAAMDTDMLLAHAETRQRILPMEPITIRRERVSAAEYIDFLKRTDLGSQYPRERFEERIEKLVRNAAISLTARTETEKLVGVCFCITDFAYWMFITDLGVDRNYVNQGIGRRLVNTALETAGGRDDIIVYTCANKNAIPFYQKLGMVKASDDVMELNQ